MPLETLHAPHGTSRPLRTYKILFNGECKGTLIVNGKGFVVDSTASRLNHDFIGRSFESAKSIVLASDATLELEVAP